MDRRRDRADDAGRDDETQRGDQRRPGYGTQRDPARRRREEHGRGDPRARLLPRSSVGTAGRSRTESQRHAPSVTRGQRPIRRRPAHAAGPLASLRVAVTAAAHASGGDAPFASCSSNAASSASDVNPSAGQRPRTSDGIPAAATAHASASMAPPAPAPNDEPSGAMTTFARAVAPNHSRASHRPSFFVSIIATVVFRAAEVPASEADAGRASGLPAGFVSETGAATGTALSPPSRNDENNGTGAFTCSGADRNSTSEVSSSVRDAA